MAFVSNAMFEGAMKAAVTGLNPQMLVWARSSLGQTVDQVAESLGKPPEVIRSWEAGYSAPTYAQLEILAYSIYKRPIAIFFFPEPPEEATAKTSFRTLPDFELAELAADTRFKLRDALALQHSLRELSAGTPTPGRSILKSLRVDLQGDVSALAAKVRTYLNITLDRQTREWTSTDKALEGWRAAVEDAGVFVFKNSFKQDDVLGFCLFDRDFPLIYLNNSTAKVRQIFTLAHELAHLLAQISGITRPDDRFVARLRGDNRRTEVFCNKLAAEILVPEEDLRQIMGVGSPDDTKVEALANRYRVSREVVLRRYLDFGSVAKAEYERRTDGWAQEYARLPKKKGKANYYSTQASYLSLRFMRVAFQHYYQGAISADQLASHLRVRPTSLSGLETAALRRVAR